MPTSPSQNAALIVSAVPSYGPPKITLTWYTYVTASNYTVHRKLKNDTSWTQISGTLGPEITQYVDSTLATNTYYEYKVQRGSSFGAGYGYVSSGIELSTVESRGKMFLVVDDFFLNSSNPITTELAQLQADLVGDGWVIIRLNVSRSDSTSTVRNQIKTLYDAAPANDKPKMVFLLGHIAPYMSANISPDGHVGTGFGCDAFYGEMTSAWSSPPTSMPSDVEMGVGRVDFYNLPIFTQTEEVLMKNYLNKLHEYKMRGYVPGTRMVIRDNFTYITDPLSETAYRTFGSLVGLGTQSGTYSLTPLTDISPMCPPCFFYGKSHIINAMSQSTGYLWGYISGGGGYDEIESGNGDHLTSYDLTLTNCNITFNMMMGSYFGNWNNPGTASNILRSALASGKCLTNCWVGQPAWHFHHMGMGDPIGYSTMQSVNNRTTNDIYQPQNTGWTGDGYTTIHLSLMGDPTLRMRYVAPPSNLSVTSAGPVYTFTWGTASGTVSGYNVYQVIDGATPSRVNNNLIQTNSFTSSSTNGINYMVRSVKLESGSGGSYYNMSTGVFGSLTMSVANFQLKVLLGGAYKALTGASQSNNGIMRDDIRALGLLPLSDPYPLLGYTHSGTASSGTVSQSLIDTQGSNAPVDWIIVEIRSAGAPATVLQSMPCLVRKNGEVINTSNSTTIQPPLASGSYHVAVKHRNHLGVMTKNPITINSSGPIIDFTNPSTLTYGTSSQMIIGSYSCLWSGNANFNTDIKYTGMGNDRDPILVKIGSTNTTAVVQAYCLEDVNMDGYAKYTGTNNDRDLILVNVGGTTPNNSIAQQIP